MIKNRTLRNKKMIKDVLKNARLRKGLTQEQVAKEVKVAKQTYLKWENGETEPRATQIANLAKTLNVSANEICQGVEFGKLSLQDFIIELSQITVPREIVTMTVWEQLEDHYTFLGILETREKQNM
ncbi:helix-turn-helix transcriptional regulator [Vibrio metschnikovii]|nr:helix-turn-helix transcriptional regulator [Vibrio metschnikovii]EKO3608547.1 helix-turn-helix transcriptional regulator [Vibrio metschnikovii]EKO3647584.1 helix-turn-helix transcriptional regulator [Vibrio metschnikovii]EKO3664365.1 helix-turn-helix transcriptional regulator [Vibrio metschnikovii]EKO3914655.1 helix-turn-helix transcriptional regulator [Vibrio metschnikovii]